MALTKVQSFGTEVRPTDHPIPPRDEYITFCGSDTQDVAVCELPNPQCSCLRTQLSFSVHWAHPLLHSGRGSCGPFGGTFRSSLFGPGSLARQQFGAVGVVGSSFPPSGTETSSSGTLSQSGQWFCLYTGYKICKNSCLGWFKPSAGPLRKSPTMEQAAQTAPATHLRGHLLGAGALRQPGLHRLPAKKR